MRTLLLSSALALIAFAPTLASAHAFGQSYSLPLPVAIYVIGGVCALIASCALLLLVGRGREPRAIEIVMSDGVWKLVRFTLRFLAMALLALVIAAGFLGHEAPYDNLLTVSFWIGLVLFIPYLSVLIDGLWDIGNPFRRIASFFAGEIPTTRVWKYGYLPALVGYILLIVLELFLQQYAISPLFLAAALIFFITVLSAGVMRFGLGWANFGDFFSLFFRLVGLLAPIRVEAGKILLQLPAWRLAKERVEYLTIPAFILFALAATAFDGLRETNVWYRIINALPVGSFVEKSFFGFIIIPLVFFGLYALAMLGMRALLREQKPLRVYVLRFALSLVPIMIAYHFAHYFTLLLTTGTYAVSLISDPLGQGWNLFGTADLSPTILIGAQWIWYIQFAAIVGGHIFAAYVAHKIALEEFRTKYRAMLSQLPLVVLMVLYTAFGLWILAQPYAPPTF